MMAVMASLRRTSRNEPRSILLHIITANAIRPSFRRPVAAWGMDALGH